jgi:hypothetical protein
MSRWCPSKIRMGCFSGSRGRFPSVPRAPLFHGPTDLWLCFGHDHGPRSKVQRRLPTFDALLEGILGLLAADKLGIQVFPGQPFSRTPKTWHVYQAPTPPNYFHRGAISSVLGPVISVSPLVFITCPALFSVRVFGISLLSTGGSSFQLKPIPNAIWSDFAIFVQCQGSVLWSKFCCSRNGDSDRSLDVGKAHPLQSKITLPLISS